jgi:hypothetical protein
LDVGLDASGCNLDSFLHETCLLAEFSRHLWKLISPTYDIVFCYNLEHLYTFESGIQQNWVCINWTSEAPGIEFWMTKGQHWQNARFDFKGCDFHALCLFIFLDLDFQKGMDVSFLIPLESLRFNFYNSRSAQTIDWTSNQPITSNLLLFASFI